MKSLFVVLMVIVVTESRQVCEPNKQFMQDCNTCFCAADGTSMGCTFMDCIDWNLDNNEKHDGYADGAVKIAKRSVRTRRSVYGKKCVTPGESFKHYCNTCACNKDGRVGRCTRMYCDERVYNEDGTYKFIRQDDTCEASKSYSPDSCNTCICNKYGNGSICTNENCVSNLIETDSEKQIEKWGTLKEYNISCRPDEAFYNRCNLCVCSRNGKTALCTTIEC